MSSVLEVLNSYSTYSWPRLLISTLHAPTYHIYFELILLCGIIWLIFQRSYRIKDNSKLTEKEKQILINEWVPEPIVPHDWVESKELLKQFDSYYTEIKKYIKVPGKDKELCNFATMNFLDLSASPTSNTIEALNIYGVGSCGPRGFYGTFSVHIDFETAMAKFLNVQDVIFYSYGFSTTASAIPSYSKRNDIIFTDCLVNQSIYQGLIASRSTVIRFFHNDLDGLEGMLQHQEKIDKIDPRKAATTRKFVVVEALYRDTGEICDLKRLIKLKYRYKFRLIVDESHSIGILGNTGRGATEYHGVDINDIDMISGSLENAFGNYGGFCAGSNFVIDHQRLSGAGYCFSASSPPLLAVAALDALKKLDEERGLRQKKLSYISNYFSQHLDKKTWRCDSHMDSPIKHINLKLNSSDKLNKDLENIVQLLKEDETNPQLVTFARHSSSPSKLNPNPSIRICLKFYHSESEVKILLDMLSKFGKMALARVE